MKRLLIAAGVLAVAAVFLFAGSKPKTQVSAEQSNQPGAVSLNRVSKETAPAVKEKDGAKKKYKVTFVELGSVRCIPCKMMIPIMEEVERRFGDEVLVVFHDVWTQEGQPYADKYKIRGIPTQVFLDADGKEFFRHTGFFPKEELFKVLEKGGVNINAGS